VKASDRGIIVGVAVVVLAVLFYMTVLGPKRKQASDLGSQIDSLNSSISQQQQVADFGEQARRSFPRYYGRLVLMGKAVPQEADTSSMLVQLSSTSSKSNVDLRGITLSEGASGAGTSTAPAPTSATSPTAAASSTSAATSTTSTTSTTPSPSGSTTPTTATPATPVPATETAAAAQPLGATVGVGGLPTMPYDLTFTGGYFDVANFIGGLDSLVKPRDSGAEVAANGRLFTVDGFTLSIGAAGPSHLDAKFQVTTYVAPPDQGLTAGASPSAPAPTSPSEPQAQPASASVAQ
jgi:Tfp pilus assembly protein PilO